MTFDWVVEEAFADIPKWHPLVGNVIPVALRRWRKGVFSSTTRREWKRLREQLHEQKYDLILDAQGLVKSAFLTFFAKGKRAGLDWGSARESLASVAYQHKCTVNFYQHAIVRMRSLFAQALSYPLPETEPDFGLNSVQFNRPSSSDNYLVFLHGTTWPTKQWPESYWIQLAEFAAQAGYRVKLSGSHPDEVERATRLATQSSAIDTIPNLSIAGMAELLVHAKAAVAVDTGLGHLAAALGVPTVSIYGSTNPAYTGALGKKSIHLAAHFSCAPCLSRTCTFKAQTVENVSPACYSTVKPIKVWEAVSSVTLRDGAKSTPPQGERPVDKHI